MADTLIVVAHPDDELLYFLPLLPRAMVVCVTNGEASGADHRPSTFAAVCEHFGATPVCLGMADRPRGFFSWEVKELVHQLRAVLLRAPAVTRVFTHGPAGEYGHPQHRQVSEVMVELVNERSLPAFRPFFEPHQFSAAALIAYPEVEHQVAALRFLQQYGADLGPLPLSRDYPFAWLHQPPESS